MVCGCFGGAGRGGACVTHRMCRCVLEGPDWVMWHPLEFGLCAILGCCDLGLCALFQVAKFKF